MGPRVYGRTAGDVTSLAVALARDGFLCVFLKTFYDSKIRIYAVMGQSIKHNMELMEKVD